MKNSGQFFRAQHETGTLWIGIAIPISSQNPTLPKTQTIFRHDVVGIGFGRIIRLEAVQIEIIELFDRSDKRRYPRLLAKYRSLSDIDMTHAGLEHLLAEIVLQSLQDFFLSG